MTLEALFVLREPEKTLTRFRAVVVSIPVVIVEFITLFFASNVSTDAYILLLDGLSLFWLRRLKGAQFVSRCSNCYTSVITDAFDQS